MKTVERKSHSRNTTVVQFPQFTQEKIFIARPWHMLFPLPCFLSLPLSPSLSLSLSHTHTHTPLTHLDNRHLLQEAISKALTSENRHMAPTTFPLALGWPDNSIAYDALLAPCKDPFLLRGDEECELWTPMPPVHFLAMWPRASDSSVFPKSTSLIYKMRVITECEK